MLIGIVCLIVYIIFNPHVTAKPFFSTNQNFKELNIEGIEFFVHEDVELDVLTIKKGLQQTRERMETLFGTSSADDVNVFVTLPGDRVYDWFLGTGNLGMYHTSLKLIAIDAQYIAELSATIFHEYSHHLFQNYLLENDLTQESVPEWIFEGLALTFEYELMDHVLIKYGPMFHSIPFSRLEIIEGVNLHSVYIQGFYGTMYLLEHYGEGILHKLLKETANSSFDAAWSKLIDEPYETFHEKFFINQGMIRKAENLQENKEELIAHVEALMEQRGKLNVYTPFVSRELIEAYIHVGEHEKAKETFEVYEPFITTPTEFADIANLLKKDQAFQAKLLEKGAQYAKRYGYDVEAYEKYIDAIK